jgi:copper chaperone CopZ
MLKTTLEIEGMMCGMCESHINDTIRNNFRVEKVSSSHSKGRTEIISEETPDEQELKKALSALGYDLKSIRTEPCTKKKFLFF